MGAALAKGDVDAAFLIEPFVTTAPRDGDRILDYSYSPSSGTCRSARTP